MADDERKPGIAGTLHDLITGTGLSVGEVAAAAGMDPANLELIVNGKRSPSIEDIEAIFDACEADFTEWLDDSARHARDKILHDRIQVILDANGPMASSLRTSINAVWILFQRERRP